MTASFALKVACYGTLQRTRKERAPTVLLCQSVSLAPASSSAGLMRRGKRCRSHISWQDFLDIVEAIRKTDEGKKIYAQRKEMIERVFADAKEKHAMCDTHHRGLATVTRLVRLKYTAMSLKKLANWSRENSCLRIILAVLPSNTTRTPVFA